MSFFKYIKAVATGPKSNRDLTYEEIQEAIQQILEQKCESEQAAAFLMCLRVKLESDDELKGTLKSFDKYIKRDKLPQSVELGFSYDGKTDQPFLFPLTAQVLEAFFAKNTTIEPFFLVVSGDLEQPAKHGLTLKEVAQSATLSSVVRFYDRVDYFRELSQLTVLRKKLFMRSVFNTVEKLLNPAQSNYAITSAFHKPYVQKYFKLFGENYQNMWVIKGSEGNPEVFADFKYWYMNEGEITEKSVSLKEFNIQYNNEYEKISLEENLKLLENPSEVLMDLARLNAAILLVTAQRYNTIEEAYAVL
ncbi:glycosyl transferase [Candidatus Marinarcus aquaticus]|uniref:Glycosyl transferase n=1 Tax=Candidatus Marinarcus aquaticus TaxID=2044504 RepID=A0A4Q0XPR8_9BACT|nr:glycosyl transferase [Candidatus Marinarcus aquaticus]RXJ57612.1 glycosyl transferase [Candidatus Marinarcus aquaticus]